MPSKIVNKDVVKCLISMFNLHLCFNFSTFFAKVIGVPNFCPGQVNCSMLINQITSRFLKRR